MTPTVVRIDRSSPQPRLLDATGPLISIEDEGYTRGDGAFETMLALDLTVRKLDLHLLRLAQSSRLLHLPRYDDADWQAAIELALSAAPAGTPSELGAEHTVKLLLSRGTPAEGPYGLVVVSAVPESTIAQRRDGVRAMLLPRGHDPAEDTAYPWLLAGAKTLSYAVNMAVLRHVRSLGAQDAIFTASDRRILEGATSSVIVARRDGDALTLLTPEPSHGILPGTTQGAIFEGARADGWELGFGPLYPADLLESDGVWLSSSVRLLAPVARLNNQALPVDRGLTDRLLGYLMSR
ncbi:aminotransferase class IV [Rothia sp. AR01]|uniref:Aminotransferase class IV n=1 Tax=Rothia santali TaxID=2949643 RepID=A0A9X2H9A6_9MICC|nr:aminotransferase class IV [Rothia santali]MCP3425459.1 aminotransferase class IV [Rothia santali]